jgi:hypothetical protein
MWVAPNAEVGKLKLPLEPKLTRGNAGILNKKGSE